MKPACLTKLWHLTACLCLFLLSRHGLAFDYSYINYTIEDGLPSSQLYNVVQDKNGYLWFSTDHGLVRYDGYAFKTYTIADGLPENEIMRLYQQADGRIWGATYNGKLFYFNDSDYVFHHYKYNHLIKRWKQAKSISSIYITSDKTLYIAQGIAGFTCIDSLGSVEYHMYEAHWGIRPNSAYLVLAKEHGRKDGATFVFKAYEPNRYWNHLEDFVVDTANMLGEPPSQRLFGGQWAVGQNPVYSYCHLLVDKRSGLRKRFVNGIMAHGLLDENKVWVGEVEGGVSIYNGKGELEEAFLPGKTISDVFVDHAGGMWIMTLYSGIFYIKNKAFQKVLIPEAYENGIADIIATPQGQVLLTYGVRSLLFDIKLRKLLHPDKRFKHALYSDVYASLVLKQPGEPKVYIGANAVQLGSRGGVRCMNEDYYSKEFYLIGMGRFYVIDQYHKSRRYRFGHEVYTICNSGKGGWYLGASDGLFHYTPEGDVMDLGDEIPLFKTWIRGIKHTPAFHLVCTRDLGLIVMGSDTLFTIDASNGLSTNSLETLYQENDTVFWVCSNKGISRVSINTDLQYTITNFTEHDGLISNEVRGVAISRDTVWVATAVGVCKFPNQNGKLKEPKTDFLRINAIHLNNLKLKPATLPKTLAHNQNNLKFDFNAISFRNAGDITYRYRIDGLETQWNFGKSRQANYSSLPPGDYAFVLESDTGDGFDERLHFPFSILKPYYATWWFRTLWLIGIAMVVYWFFRVRILVYNRDIVREMLRHILKWVKRKEQVVVIKDKGKNIRVLTKNILYLQSSGNYIDIVTANATYTTRAKIGEILQIFPDPMEFMRIHRSYIIRLDKVLSYDKKTVTLSYGQEIPIGSSYKPESLKMVL